MTDLTADAAAPGASAPSALYRAIWRWHFYAGLIAMPFMILLAVTGAIYVFKDEVNRALYRDLMVVEGPSDAVLSPAVLVGKALAAHPGATFRGFIPPRWPDSSAAVRIRTGAGKAIAYLDPRDGRLLGTLSDGGSAGSPFMLVVRKLHSLEIAGWVPNRVIEIVGGWAIILVLTGLWLWWPRGQAGGVVTIRATPARRVFWRDVHAVTGVFAGLLIAFLALSGMPWSGFWGNQVNMLADANGYGYPPEFWNEVPKSTVPMKETVPNTPWALENTPTPASTPDGTEGIGIDRVLAILEGLGVPAGYAVNAPDGPEGVWSASVFPDNVAEERVIHLDRYSGAVLFDGGWKDLGAAAKAIEWGISVHMGQEFGVANQILMLAATLAILVMAAAALTMWWKRRPKGSLGAPRVPEGTRIPAVILLAAVAIGVAFPLVGLSIVVALAIDLVLPNVRAA
jgi:uncharacterized iron-regulated membrane protein